MKKKIDISHIRTDYIKHQLSESEVDKDPIKQFEVWFKEALDSAVKEPNAMTLATSVNGRPSVRIVLIKGFDDQGFVFFTNYSSRKGRELAENPLASLNFFWPELERQVRIEGTINKISQEESEAYYQSRDRGSRIGAWASSQSQIIPDRDFLEASVKEIADKYPDETYIPKPDFWGGYRLVPDYVEFWQGRKSRLHDRIVYRKGNEDNWEIVRLAP